MEEEWRDIKGYEGQYMVSNFGNVKSLERYDKYNRRVMQKNLKPFDNKAGKGYLCVNLGRKAKAKKIHRLVAEAFIPNPQNKKEVNHMDGNVKNNKVNNLEWVTHQENCLHYTYELEQSKGQYKMRPVMIFNDKEKLKFQSIKSAIRWIQKNTKYIKAETTNACRVINKNNYTMYGFKWREI